MLPWPMRPRVVDLEPVDAAVADADAVDVERLGDDARSPVRVALISRPRCASHATPAKPPLSSSTVPLTSIVPFSSTPARLIASAA